jgi:NCAIR mutase (PurE)-related protein
MEQARYRVPPDFMICKSTNAQNNSIQQQIQKRQQPRIKDFRVIDRKNITRTGIGVIVIALISPYNSITSGYAD